MSTETTAVEAPAEVAQTFRPYAEMVEKLFKKMGNVTEEFLHAAIGMSGEAAELQDGIHSWLATPNEKTLKNIPEELGDLRFYMQAIWNMYGWEWDSFVIPEPTATGIRQVGMHVTIECGNVLDIIKKQWVYGKEVDVIVLHDRMEALLMFYNNTMHMMGYSDEFIQLLKKM